MKTALHIKGAIPQEDVTIGNTPIFSIGAPNFIQQILKGIKTM